MEYGINYDAYLEEGAVKYYQFFINQPASALVSAAHH